MSAQRRGANRRESTGSQRGERGERRAARTVTVDATSAAAAPTPAAAGAAAPAAPVSGGQGGAAGAARSARSTQPKAQRVPKGQNEVPRSVLRDRAASLRKLYEDSRSEMRKISWPDRETTRNLTIVVIGVSVALGILLGGIDYVLFQIFEALP